MLDAMDVGYRNHISRLFNISHNISRNIINLWRKLWHKRQVSPTYLQLGMVLKPNQADA